LTVVVDGSALVLAVADTTERGRRARELLADGAVAPHLVDAEVGQGVRGLVLRRVLDVSSAERSMRAAEHLVIERFPHPPLRRRSWALRDTISYYDGLYVALAELLDLPLVTADAKLVSALPAACRHDLV
jgi:predicted nucleic acid-binding protein